MSAHQADVELAQACLKGDEPAWERLVREQKPILLRAADAIDPTGGARDLAEELFADLYSQTLLKYYQGRSSLTTWLRAVLAQRFVDRVRARRRFADPVDDAAPAPELIVPLGESACRACVRAAINEALAALPASDRLLVGLYYSQGLKLAAIGRLRYEHEATVSRHISRVRESLRTTVEAAMVTSVSSTGMSVPDCLRLVMDDAGDLDLAVILARFGDEPVHNKRNTRGD